MKTLKKTYTIAAPIHRVWEAFIDPSEIDGWGGGPARMSDEEDAPFSLWGGDIYGKNIEVVPEEKLVQEWYGGKWDRPSLVTFHFSEEDDETTVELVHTHIPDKEVHDIDMGWDDYYLGAIKRYLES